MAGHVEQAFRDFHEFLSGARAPALIGQSLATVVVQDQATVAAAVIAWAYGRPSHERFDALVAARNKVFDIFFYRVVRFRRIFDFFDRFEDELIVAAPEADRPYLARMLAESPWREIRPVGSFRDPLEFALDKRRRAPVQRDRFNSHFYRNATHQLLSTDKRHTFDDERTSTLVSLYQGQLAAVFDDFVDLIKDPQQRREILLANTADKHAVYASKSRFDLANYLSHLVEFVIALVNDDFFEHGIQVFGVVRQVHKDFKIDVGSIHWQRFRSQCDLLDRQKLAEYGSTPSQAVLLRSFLPLFEVWNPPQLLETILLEDERRARKLAVSLLGAYGHEVYELVVERLRSSASSPWYYTRNLAYLLSRIVTGNEVLKRRAVEGLAPHLDISSPRQLSLQVVAALGVIATPEAVGVLAAKLDEFGKRFAERDSAEICHKIVSTLFGIGTDRSLEAAGEFCLARNLVGQYREEFARATLPESLRRNIVGRIRQEVRKMRFTGSLLGKTSTARMLLTALGHSGYPEVDELCRELVAAYPAKHELASESARILAVPPPTPPIAPDRLLHSYLSKMDLPQALCHAYDAGTSGRIDVRTRDGAVCSIDLCQGRVIGAEASDSSSNNEAALYRICLLEPREIVSVGFTPSGRMPGPDSIKSATSDLLRDIVFQRAEVRQIVDGIISPESRFRRRDVHPIYTDFSRLPDPSKFASVWNALAIETDMKAIQAATGLSRHDIFRILLHFHRRNMLSVDTGHRDAGGGRVSDALATIEVYIRRIEQRPLQFRFYHTAADGCAFLERHAADEVVREAAHALGGYLGDAYASHRAFVEADIGVCRRTLELMSEFHMGGNAADRQALVEYVSFSFGTVSVAHIDTPLVSRSLLEQLENIEFCNDAFDPVWHDCDEHSGTALVEAIGQALLASGVAVGALSAGEVPTQTEAKILRELFSDVATAYTKPLKDFVREVERVRATGEPVASGWLRVMEPSIRLLSKIGSVMQFHEAQAIVESLERALDEELPRIGREVPADLCNLVLDEHRRLAALAPLAFALDLSDEQLAIKKSELLATFVLRQVDGVTDDVFDKLAAGSLMTFEAFLDAVPEDIVVAAGIDPSLAEEIFMKFYQYHDLYRHEGDPAAHPKYPAMFEIGLTTLKEICVELDKIAHAEHAGRDSDAARKTDLLASRQRALASLLALLCVRGQYDRIEGIQLVPFELRVRMLDEYFAAISGEAPLPTPPPTSDGGSTVAEAGA
jgi:hypothetical protein